MRLLAPLSFLLSVALCLPAVSADHHFGHSGRSDHSGHEQRRHHPKRRIDDPGLEGNSTFTFQKRYSDAPFTYYADGLGACGQTNGPNDFIVALNSAQYGSGEYCFQMISISVGSLSTTAQIVDECPGCGEYGLDLSEGLFEFFAPTSVGVLSGTWNFESGGGGSSAPATSSPPPPPPPPSTSSPPPPPPTTSSPPPPPPPPPTTTSSSSTPPPPPPTTSSSSPSSTPASTSSSSTISSSSSFSSSSSSSSSTSGSSSSSTSGSSTSSYLSSTMSHNSTMSGNFSSTATASPSATTQFSNVSVTITGTSQEIATAGALSTQAASVDSVYQLNLGMISLGGLVFAAAQVE